LLNLYVKNKHKFVPRLSIL